jgi:hypothetical protein
LTLIGSGTDLQLVGCLNQYRLLIQHLLAGQHFEKSPPQIVEYLKNRALLEQPPLN